MALGTQSSAGASESRRRGPLHGYMNLSSPQTRTHGHTTCVGGKRTLAQWAVIHDTLALQILPFRPANGPHSSALSHPCGPTPPPEARLTTAQLGPGRRRPAQPAASPACPSSLSGRSPGPGPDSRVAPKQPSPVLGWGGAAEDLSLSPLGLVRGAHTPATGCVWEGASRGSM